MARRFVRGRRGRRLMFHVKRGKGRIVKAHYDVIPIYNTLTNGCQPHIGQVCNVSDDVLACSDTSVEDLTQCCATVATEELISNETVEDRFRDKMKVVRLLGWVKLKLYPFYSNTGDTQWPMDCEDLTNVPKLRNYVAKYSQMVAMGIHRFRRSQAGAIDEFSTSAVDASDVSSPLLSYPWTEGKWVWQRHRFWAPELRHGIEHTALGSFAGCCPDVSGGFAANSLSSGTGTINTAISTDCNPCFVTNSESACPDQRNSYQASLPPWQTFPVRLRKPVVLDGDESLRLQIGIAHPRTLPAQIQNQGGWGCSESRNSGTPGIEKTYFAYHMKLYAVVQTNY